MYFTPDEENEADIFISFFVISSTNKNILLYLSLTLNVTILD